MQGLMMDAQLSITTIMHHAEMVAGSKEIVSRMNDGTIHRYTYADAFLRARQLANTLEELAIGAEARVGTLAWNDYRHFELHYAIPCSGRICHTINPKLFPEQIKFIINDAEDEALFIDPQFIPLLESMSKELPSVRHWIALCSQSELPISSLPNLQSYENLISRQSSEFDWPEFDEKRASGLCYTSGTTGNPKGVLGNHRSIVLHGMAQNMASSVGLTSEDVVMPLVPMFHVNAWGMPYNAPMAGAKLVLPGPHVADAESMVALVNSERVTFSLAVPTLWSGINSYLNESGASLPSLKRGVIGGAAGALSLYEDMDRHGVTLENGWGMTELSPMGSYNRSLGWHTRMSDSSGGQQRLKSGRPLFGMQMRIVDEDGNSLPHDGKTTGVLEVRAPWACQSYFGGTQQHTWFSTGDVATLDPNGYMQITDRVKDVIKSGGEWISSIEIENAIMSHPGVREAVVIGVSHEHWSERPLLIVVPEDLEPELTAEALLTFLQGKVPKWWIPNACEFVDELPHTATGKVSKKSLREVYDHYQWPGA
ncbi:long-chain fatty acid--CoA ligase [Marinobacter sp. F3R08]|uniref:long-chain fatty acid--CoA ligase n=1 Tax=Marinobacter sp. F3R08 TaxID=2841559 RepID=UPI001C0971E5|nr:long-chain fatty acid--CoA ligase [Marinobacter sp. F3R08]MBU2952917.1 long-chain fatty acid--CoA ligase [Marinobacter sp. F3R08]